MNNRRTIGITFTVLGLLTTCCLCPLALNSLSVLVTRQGLYGRIFRGVSMPQAVNYISNGQIVCTSILALIVLIAGIVVLVQARGNGSATGEPQ